MASGIACGPAGLRIRPVSKSKRREWRRMIEGYLQKRQTLQCAFILLDANVPPQQIDIDFINWLGKGCYSLCHRLHQNGPAQTGRAGSQRPENTAGFARALE